MRNLPTRSLGRNGPDVTVICLGTWGLGGGLGAIEEKQASGNMIYWTEKTTTPPFRILSDALPNSRILTIERNMVQCDGPAKVHHHVRRTWISL